MANEFKIKKGLIVTGATGGTVVDIQGSQGQLFSVTDNLTGSNIFAVSDISGVPILQCGVDYGYGNVSIDMSYNNGYTLNVGSTGNGSIITTGRIFCGDDFYVQGEAIIPSGPVIVGLTSNFNSLATAKVIVKGNQTFGLPGLGVNNNGRWLSIEGNADASGEGSGRIFFTEHNSTTASMDNYGMSLGYRGGATSIVGASGNTWTGLTQIGNGDWGMFGHNNDATGALIMSGDRAATYVDFAGNNIQGITNATITTVTGSLVGNATTATTATSATSATQSNNVAITGYGNGNFTFYQTSGTFAGYTGWANYFIGNHGNGSNYYNTIHIMPFWGAPKYSRLAGNVQSAVYDYWTSENFTPGNYLPLTGGSLTGDLGINTASPNQKLHVNGATQLGDISATVNFGTVALKVVEGTVATGPTLGSGAVGAQAVLYSNGQFGMYTGVSTNGDTWMQSQRNDTGTSTYDILLNPAGGKVAIGHNDPTGKLDVFRPDTNYSVNLSDTLNRAGLIVKSSGAYDSKITFSSGASSRQYIQALNNAGNTGRDISINPFGGNVGIGTSAAGQKLTVNGRALIQNSTTPFYIKVNSTYKSWVHHIASNDTYVLAPSTADGGETWDWPNQTAFSTSGVVTANNFVLSSDKRNKTKIEDLTGNNVDISWKSFEMKGNEGEYRTGVIAQELEENHPEFINTDDRGFKSVKYIDLLIAKIAELEARLEILEK